jgi:uncharacterized protein YkuJ
MALAEDNDNNIINIMTRLERLKQKLAEAQRKQANLARNGKLIESFAYNTRIANLKDEIAEAEQYEFQPLTNIIADNPHLRNEVNLKLLKLLLFADLMQDASISVKDTLSKMGVADIHLAQLVEQVRRIVADMVKIVDMPGLPTVSEAFQDDDKVIDDLNLLADRFLKSKFVL